MKEQFEKQHTGVILPLEEDQVLRARVREAAKQAKIQLSDVTETRIRIPDLWTEDGKPLGLDAKLTREKFEDLVSDHLQRTIKIVADTIEAAKIKPTDLSQILMVGGQTRTPAVRQALKDAFDRPLNTSVLPEEAVARGAAVLGARLCGYLKDQVSLWDAIPLSLGVELASGAMDVVIPRNEPIPVEKWRRGDQAFTTQKDRQKSIRFKVWQGERPMAADNSYVGEVILLLTTSRSAGEHRINVLFTVDHNGIVTVRAESADTDARPAEAVFAPKSMLPAEVQKMLEEAKRHREEDELTRCLQELGAELDSLRDFVGDDAGAELETLFEQAADALDERDADRAAQLINDGKEQVG
jgi:molecular chaperone DnaK